MNWLAQASARTIQVVLLKAGCVSSTPRAGSCIFELPSRELSQCLFEQVTAFDLFPTMLGRKSARVS